jgi:phage baseplate assembly protein W
MTEVIAPQLSGIGLPLLRRGGGYFAPKTKYDVAFSDILHAVFTPAGSRPMSREFGSAVHLLLFEPSSLTLKRQIDYVIRQAVSKWAPHLYISRVLVELRGVEVAVGIIFGLVAERTDQERLVLLTKSDVARLISAQERQ